MITKSLSKFTNKLNTFFRSKLSVYIWLFFIITLCFGILIPVLGFYWDDLPYLYQYAAFGPGGFPAFVASDRPYSAWIFSATTFLFRYNPIGYHILALLLRWVCAILFFETIQLIWKENRGINLAGASIFAIYPGFLQQPIALIYNHHLSVFAFLLLSFYLMILNESREKRIYLLTIISILLSFGMFSIENFSTLELIRPFILWKILKEKKPSQKNEKIFLEILRVWIPYLLVFLTFVVWRVFIFKFPTYKPTFFASFIEDPSSAWRSLIARIPSDIATVTYGAWFHSFRFLPIGKFGVNATYLLWTLIIFTFLVSLVVFHFWIRKSDGSKNRKTKTKLIIEMVASSILLFFLPVTIVWILDFPLKIEFAWDRMTIAFIPSIALLTGGFLSIFNRTKAIQLLLLSLLICFAVGSHFQTAMDYKRAWENLEDFIWQLSWRVPSLEENTMLIASGVGLKYYSDNSLTSPVNLMFSENISRNQIPYLVYYTDVSTRYDKWLEEKIHDMEFNRPYRSFNFRGNTDDIITFHFQPPGCIMILDSKYSNTITNPNLSTRQTDEILFSKIDRISAQPTHTPFYQLFGQQSTESWCYYFEKADLARQFGDYDEIIRLGDVVIKSNEVPRIESEWFPFLEGYLWRAKWEKSNWIINKILSAEDDYSDGICYTLDRIINNPKYPYHSELSEIISFYNCSQR